MHWVIISLRHRRKILPNTFIEYLSRAIGLEMARLLAAVAYALLTHL
jgi:hypothetical protein